ncbi:MAG: extracellular solute-binding protein [Hyphomicrobiales bacterium]
MRLLSILTLSLLMCLPVRAKDLTIVSWGGAYEAAQQRALLKPFVVVTGSTVSVRTYAGGLDAIRERAKAEAWDVIDMSEDEAIAACELGLIAKVDVQSLLVPVRGTILEEDFLPGALRECSVAQNLFATVFAYDDRAYPGVKPTRIEDFFDVKNFPGKRALQSSPDVILEWALLAEGVPARQVYDLLSTDRGLRLAFRKLDALRGHIVWWRDPQEPARLLSEGEVSMASGFNGRFFAVANDDDAPVNIVWDGQIISFDVLAISASSNKKELAEEFIAYATQPDQMARLAEHIPYGPARRSAFNRIGLHWRSQVPMRNHLPGSVSGRGRALYRDAKWYAHTQDLRNKRFEAWMKAE